MKRIVAAFAAVSIVVSIAAFVVGGDAPREARADASPAPVALATRLRYIGRDPATGLPSPVDDHFIAESEAAIARYGKDEREPVPPPPVDGPAIVKLSLPALGVEGPVATYGVDRFGRLDVPQDNATIGWHPAYADLPGRGAATFFAAHYEYLGVPGVFFRLSASKPGDVVVVSLADGSTHRYLVTSVVDYALATIDMGALLQGREGAESITLMTCSGPANEGEYALRTVVLAERLPG
ncbi:MAG: class F sortase [Chloroflexi bacterium]|nr:class F sortase [Chloroflexota bacterium]